MPPRRMPLARDRRPLKRWRYAGVYGPELMLCAGLVRVAGVPQGFWAVWDRRAGGGRLLEHTAVGRTRAVALPGGAVRVRDPRRGVEIDLALEPAGEPVEVISRHGASYAWTRKQPALARGTVTLAGEAVALHAGALVDESAGYHARHTAWDWCAGTGRTPDGRTLHWSLVAGLHDAETASERTVWVDGDAREAAPAPFAPSLDAVGDLRFVAEAQRARHDRLVVLESEYRQPFGTFSGTLPGGLEVAEGWGVMERHRARW